VKVSPGAQAQHPHALSHGLPQIGGGPHPTLLQSMAPSGPASVTPPSVTSS
jgi:hypothetical protein